MAADLTSATPLCWLLNLDAELELAEPRSYAPSPSMEARISALRPRMAMLLRACDRVLGLDLAGTRETTPTQSPDPDHTRALAFCPTPSALLRIERAGLRAPPAPPLEVLRAVNSRAFCAQLGQTLEHASYVRTHDELTRALAASSPSGSWLLKREFSFAGRERRRVDGSTLDAPTAGFVRRSFARGEGLQLEPLLPRTHDFAQHGFLTVTGELLLGPPLAQECDARGAWLRSRELGPDELSEAERAALESATHQAGAALHAADYFGPFGVDAFRYRLPTVPPQFQPRSEINARFSMGYPRLLLERALRT